MKVICLCDSECICLLRVPHYSILMENKYNNVIIWKITLNVTGITLVYLDVYNVSYFFLQFSVKAKDTESLF
jgi:hypothetical protein